MFVVPVSPGRVAEHNNECKLCTPSPWYLLLPQFLPFANLQHEAPGQSAICLSHMAGADPHTLEFYSGAVFKQSALSICLLFQKSAKDEPPRYFVYVNYPLMFAASIKTEKLNKSTFCS